MRGPASGDLRGASSRSMHGVVWVDDVQVVNLVVSKAYGDKPAVHVVVTSMVAA